MEDVIRLISHLLTTRHSIDRVGAIAEQLNIPQERLLRLLNKNPSRDYFQLLRLSPQHARGSDKLALTIDLMCCTHYAQGCKNLSCPFLHLCPYYIRPAPTRCTNRACPFDHDVRKSTHNRKIIDLRELGFLPNDTLMELARASADPNRSFWTCSDQTKKNGCPRKPICDRLHYCYFALADSCTKPRCAHEVTEACRAYFRQKDIHEQDPEDILNAFKKVVRQRKSDFIDTSSVSHKTTSASSSPKPANAASTQRTPSNQQQRSSSSSSRRSTPVASASALSSYDDILSSKQELSPPLPDHEHDIHLLDSYSKEDYAHFQSQLSQEIACPIKLLIVKNIFSERKEKQSCNLRTKPTYFYCPIRNPSDVIRLLRWQNEDKRLIKPLTVYSTVYDAHNAAVQNFENNQFCMFRVNLFQLNAVGGTSQPDNRLQLSDPQSMCFDRMWVYVYDL